MIRDQSLIWISRFGILKQNWGEIKDLRIESMRGRWDTKNKSWDYGIIMGFL